jgi:hypothetical protein
MLAHYLHIYKLYLIWLNLCQISNYRSHCLYAIHLNQSAASFCHQVAAWVLDIFHNFNFVKSHKTANNSAIADDREKMSTDFLRITTMMYA